MIQLALTDIAASTTTAEPTTPPATDTNTYADNGKLWQSILNQVVTSRRSLDCLGKLLGEAVDKKIWLGLINPKTGKLCSFTYTNPDGEIDDSLSFKMWLSSAPERGGLGIDDLSIIESSIKKDREIKQKIIPLLIDRQSILLANKIRHEQGEPPLLSLNKSKEIFLRRLGHFPPIFSRYLETKKVQRDFLMVAMGAYDRLPEDRKSTALTQLENLFNSEVEDQTEISIKISKIVESDYFRQVRLSLNDVHSSAQKIVEFYNDDATALKELAKEILGLVG